MTDEFEKYDAFAKQMETRFPKMFAEPYGGFCVDEGWWPILTNLCSNIQHHLDWKNKKLEVIPQVTVAQIKEKFGGLRFYYDGGDDQIQGMVTMAKHGQVTHVKHEASLDNNEVVAGSKHSAMNTKQNANKDWQSAT